MLGISPRTLHRWRSSGLLKVIRIGGKVLVRRAEVDRLLNENEGRTASRKLRVLDQLRRDLGLRNEGDR